MSQDQRGYFEEFLREQTDYFSMRPNAAIWRSIYNNYHPNNKWPALSTLFIFFIAFMSFGINESKHESTSVQEYKKPHKADFTQGIHKENNLLAASSFSTNNTLVRKSVRLSSPQKTLIPPLETNKTGATSDIITMSDAWVDNSNPLVDTASAEKTVTVSVMPAHTGLVASAQAVHTPNQVFQDINSPIETGRESDFSYQVYATPSYGYRSLGKNDEPSGLSGHESQQAQGNTGNKYMNGTLNQYNTWNIEAGGALMWNINRMIRIKAGMQLNYSNVSLQSEASNQSKSIINNTAVASDPTITDQNITGNSSYQISMPMGTEFELTGNKTLQWYAGATIQPSYLFGNKSLALYSDLSNLAQDPDIIRRWNINTSFETYMSYKLKNGFIINAGPQIRYQLLSSFDRSFLYSEKLYNLGMKIGLSKSL